MSENIPINCNHAYEQHLRQVKDCIDIILDRPIPEKLAKAVGVREYEGPKK